MSCAVLSHDLLHATITLFELIVYFALLTGFRRKSNKIWVVSVILVSTIMIEALFFSRIFLILATVQVIYIIIEQYLLHFSLFKEFELFVFYSCMLQISFYVLNVEAYCDIVQLGILFILIISSIGYMVFMKYRDSLKQQERYGFFLDITWLVYTIISSVILLISNFHLAYYDVSRPMRKVYTAIFVASFSLILYHYIQKEVTVQMQRQKLQMCCKYIPKVDHLIEEIRANQHDYKNHIQSMVALTATCDTYEELCYEINSYARALKKDFEYTKLLTIRSKIVLGFIYSKMKEADANNVYCKIIKSDIRSRLKIENYELIRILGILFDNAIEAELEVNKNKIEFLIEQEEKIVITMKNAYPELSQSFMDEMWEKKFTTKENGEQARGYGLHTVKRIVKKYSGAISSYNERIENENYICIRIII